MWGLPSPRPGLEVSQRPWLQAVITPPVAAQDPPQQPLRLRPYIYVYDVAPEFSTDIYQYRIERGNCMWR